MRPRFWPGPRFSESLNPGRVCAVELVPAAIQKCGGTADALMPTEASDSDLVEASSGGLLFDYSGSPPLASALEWPSGNEDISRSSSFLTLADEMRNGASQPTNAHAIVPYVRPKAC